MNKLEVLLFQYKESIIRMWKRITKEVHTPPLINQNRTVKDLQKDYPHIKKNILEHTARKRKEYVITKRNKIVMEELGELYQKLTKKVDKMNITKLIDVSKLVTWDWENRNDTVQECLEHKLYSP